MDLIIVPIHYKYTQTRNWEDASVCCSSIKPPVQSLALMGKNLGTVVPAYNLRTWEAKADKLLLEARLVYITNYYKY